jgi:hypothetical protein
MLMATGTLALAGAAEPTGLPLVDRMPRRPQPWQPIDWREKARAFDRLAFAEHAAGNHLPLVRVRERGRNIAGPAFDLPTFVGAPEAKASEAITCLAAVVGGLLAGLDKADQHGRDWVAMCLDWYSPDAGVVVNNAAGRPGNSFWYDLFSAVLFFELADLQPERADLDAALRATARRWREAVVALGGPGADFNHTAFRFTGMVPHDNGRWREPDAAAGLAWLMHAAWRRTGEPQFLEAARWCLDFLERRDPAEGNPGYEVLHLFAPVVAARLNAEAGTHYRVDRLLGWCFSENLDRPAARPDWGMIVERWGAHDVHGLLGSTRDGGGYAFAMNTFHAAAALAPVARYEPRYARALGRWLLNLANNARLFYPDQWPAEQQSSAGWPGSPEAAIAYEGLRRQPRVLAPRVAEPPGAAGWRFRLPARTIRATGYCTAAEPAGPAAGAFAIECDEGAGFREVGTWPGPVSGRRPTASFAVSARASDVAVRLVPQGTATVPPPDLEVGIRCFLDGPSPFATGDPLVLGWGSATDLGLYGSAHVGFLAAVVAPANVPGTVRANLTATDFFRGPSHPTWLYYNPGEAPAMFVVEGPAAGFDLYDAVTHRFIARGAAGRAEFELAADAAAVVVVVPAGAAVTQAGGRREAGGAVIDFHLPPADRS